MKTILQTLQKAVSIADNDYNARVAVFDTRQQFQLYSMRDWMGDGMYHTVTRTYNSNSGGNVRLIHTDKLDVCEIAGCQFSHVFYQEDMETKLRATILCKLRSPYAHPEPMGAYNNYGIVFRTETY